MWTGPVKRHPKIFSMMTKVYGIAGAETWRSRKISKYQRLDKKVGADRPQPSGWIVN
jgi:hypothetical protein